MRGLTGQPFGTFAIAVLVLPICGCEGKARQAAIPVEGDQRLATIIHAADPNAALQLVRGFYGVEDNAFRWTKGSFSVLLRPPPTAKQKGAMLIVRFSIPEIIIEKLKTISLSAKVNGFATPVESYSKAGAQVYFEDVPARVFSDDTMTVDFALDKSFPGNGADRRELGVVVSVVGFESKL